MADDLQLTIRTPEGVVFDDMTGGLRVRTESGLVGLRPRGEPMVVAVDPGLVEIRRGEATSFAVTGGGLMQCGRQQCSLYTPFAVVGDSEEEMEEAYARRQAAPGAEATLRSRLEELERRIMGELRTAPGGKRRPTVG